MRADPGRFAEHRHVEVVDEPAARAHALGREGEKALGRRARAIADRSAGNACRYRPPPAHRAPRRSARAARRRRRNGRATPRSCGIRTPPSQTWSPSAEGMNVEPRADARDPVSARPAETPLGGGEIRLQRELHIGRLALEHRDPQTGPFGERAVVGKPDMTLLGRPTMRVEERSEPERLRGLDGAKPGAIRRVDDRCRDRSPP